MASPSTLVLVDNTSDISDTYLELTTDNGDAGLSIVCFSKFNRSTSILTWTKVGVDEGFPVGITVFEGPSLIGQIIKLQWRRKMHFTDSGTYMCNVTSSIQNTSVRVDLLVKRKLYSMQTLNIDND